MKYLLAERAFSGRNWVTALVLLCLLLGTLGGCKSEAPNVSGIQIDLEVQRFEHDLQRASLDSASNGATALRNTYPVFFDSVWLQLMLPGDYNLYDSSLVAAFGKQPSLKAMLDTVTQVFPAAPQAAWQTELEQAFRYARYYFPEAPTPKVITYVSELSLGNLTYGDELLGIGLDFYLGAGYRGYNFELFPSYVQRTMTPAHIAPRAIEAWINDRLPKLAGDQRMLDRMIANGKILYVKRHLLPHVADTAVLSFSPQQLTWLAENEAQMWTHYLDEKLLYETSGRRIDKHVGVSPNVPGMPPEAPGGGANWMGMRIIEAYMERKPETTLDQLLDLPDAQALLTISKYRPDR